MFKYHSDMGQCFSKVVAVSKKEVKKNFFFIYFLTFLIGKSDMIFGKRWLFLIGKGAEIRPLEMDRKGPDRARIGLKST